MPKLWLSIGIISILTSIGIYLDQELRLNASWSWDQFLHHETFIAIAGILGIVLMLVALFDKIAKNRRTFDVPGEI